MARSAGETIAIVARKEASRNSVSRLSVPAIAEIPIKTKPNAIGP